MGGRKRITRGGSGLCGGGLANLYYPRANRGLGLTLGDGLVSIAGHAVDNLIREFFLRRLRPNVPGYEKGQAIAAERIPGLQRRSELLNEPRQSLHRDPSPIGVGVGPTAGTDHWIIKGILGRHFNWRKESPID